MAKLKLAVTRTPKKALSDNFITPITPKIGYFFSSFPLFFLFNSSKSLLIPSGSKLALLSRFDIPSRYRYFSRSSALSLLKTLTCSLSALFSESSLLLSISSSDTLDVRVDISLFTLSIVALVHPQNFCVLDRLLKA